VVGSIWRRRKLRQLEKPALATAREAVQPLDR
jgi:hypothetical protein